MPTHKVLWSETAGVLAEITQKDSALEFHSIGIQNFTNDTAAQYLSTVNDWTQFECTDLEKALQIKQEEYWINKGFAFSSALITGLSAHLEKEVLAELEELLQTRVKVGKLESLLLVAPIRKPDMISKLAVLAGELNLHAASALWNEVFDLQPLLNRFSSLWLNLPCDCFEGCEYSREELWQIFVINGVLSNLVKATDRASFMKPFASLLLANDLTTSLGTRKSISRIAGIIADSLYPQKHAAINTVEEIDLEGAQKHKRKHKHQDGEKSKLNALQQINAIAGVIAEGRDALAHKYLKDLIIHQVADGDVSHITKSLCNIAQRCADMFRIDFERECLLRALELNSSDSWTLIQWGDHLKRIGDYKSALEAFNQAVALTGDIVAHSAIADVYEMQGKHSQALETYKTISNWENLEYVRTAIGDSLRRAGKFDEANIEYDYALKRWGGYRAHAGKAEILRNKLQFSESLHIYSQLISQEFVDERSKVVYRSTISRLHKLMGNYSEAYRVSDSVVHDYPFYMRARVQRASVLGLMNRAQDGLSDIPESFTTTAYGQWVSYFVKGLLLLKLDRYAEAKELLTEKSKHILDSKEGVILLRLGAAVTYLATEDYATASHEVEKSPASSNQYAEYLRQIMRLHIAASKSDEVTTKWIIEDLGKRADIGIEIDSIIRSINAKKWKDVIDLELQLCLRAA